MASDGSDVRDQSRSEAATSIFQRRLENFYRSSLSASLAAASSAVLLSALVWNEHRANDIAIWCGVALVTCLLRILTIRAFFRRTEPQRRRHARRWYWLMLALGTAVGSVWGAAGFMLLGVGNIFDQMLLFLVLAGVASGATISLAAFYSASASFLTVMVVPFALRVLSIDVERSLVLAALVLLYLLLMLTLARRANASMVESLETAYLRSRAEQQVRQQAFFDALTGLPNRRLLQDRVEQALARSRRSGEHVVMLFLDLDYFKRINDSLGHDTGDKLLAMVASRLRHLLRENDTAARLGGDEFVVLLTDIAGEWQDAVAVAQRRGEELLRAIAEPMTIDGNSLHITASVGASLLPEGTTDLGELMRQADTAMYSAKDDGRNTLHFFKKSMQEALSARLALESNLRAALANGALELHLQPQFHQDDGLCGAELLLRWRHEGEPMAPASFIAVAEESGLIVPLGNWVLEESCRLGRLLLDAGPLPAGFRLAINVSPRQFRQSDFSETLLAAVRAQDLPPELIELEVTETLLIHDIEDTARRMRHLREHGIRFSIDDFGTGYSSLSYLKSLPVDVLKVDQSFVRDLLTDPNDASIVRAIISMALTLDIDVIAEGVESEAARDILVSAGCRRFQGFLFAPALPYADFLELLRERSALSVGAL